LTETDVSPESRERKAARRTRSHRDAEGALDRISSILSVGSSLTVSDYGISEENGAGNGFYYFDEVISCHGRA